MVWLDVPPSIKQLKQLTKLTSYFGAYASFYDENATIRMAFVENGKIEHFLYDEEDESYKPKEEVSENVIDFLLTCNIVELLIDVPVEGAAFVILSKLIAKGRLVFCGASEGELNEETSQALLDLLDQDQFQYLIIGCYRTARRVLDHWKSAKAKVGRCITVKVRQDSSEILNDFLSSRAEVTSREEKLAIYSKLPYLSDVSKRLYEWRSFHERRRVYFSYDNYPNINTESSINFGVI
uniref:Uncharacterized protein n=1 Tax=Steinernema glaseri TaxID=37863 RepID=A0A1I7YFD5_9BILA